MTRLSASAADYDGYKKLIDDLYFLFHEQQMEGQVMNDSVLARAVKSFLELGQLRNELTHLNFANYPLDKPVDEIYALYQEANVFVETFLTTLRSRNFAEATDWSTGCKFRNISELHVWTELGLPQF